MAERHTPIGMIDYEALKVERPELFKPIPQRIGVTMDNPQGFPNGSVEDWRGKDDPNNLIEIQESGEPLVNLANLSPPIFASNDYGQKLESSDYETPLDGSTIAQYTRESVANMLQKAQEILPDGFKLILFDGWRSLETQYATYEMCYGSLVERLTEMGLMEAGKEPSSEVRELISRETQNYISPPSPLPESLHPTDEQIAAGTLVPSPHNTGGSVDVGIVVIDEDRREELKQLEAELAMYDDPFSLERAKVNFKIAYIYRMHSTSLDFGTAFDYAGQESGLLHQEGQDSTARDSRRMLYNAMTSAGFQPYSEEWWHFNYGNQMAKITEWKRTGEKGVAMYGNIELSEEQRWHERLHGVMVKLLIDCASGNRNSLNIPSDLIGVKEEDIWEISDAVGDPRMVRSLPKTHDMKYRGEIPTELIDAIKAAS